VLGRDGHPPQQPDGPAHEQPARAEHALALDHDKLDRLVVVAVAIGGDGDALLTTEDTVAQRIGGRALALAARRARP